MHQSKTLRTIAVAALIIPQVIAFAQDATTTISDLLNGKAMPTKIVAADLPADFKAVKLTVSGSSDMSGMFGMFMPFMLMGAMMGGASSEQNPEQEQQAQMLSFLEVSWTKGDVVKMNGRDFLVTYKPALDLTKIMASKESGPPKSFDLSLTLVAMDSFTSITPMPEVTKDDLVKFAQGLAKPPAASQQATTLSNAKQISTAMIMYASDWDDVLPYAQSTKAVQFVTYPYVKNAEVWKTLNPNGGQFQFNMALGGVSMTDVPSPAETVLYYESNEWPDGKRAVSYLDGHAKLVSAEEWAKLKASLDLKLKKTAKPLPLNYGMDWDPSKGSGGG